MSFKMLNSVDELMKYTGCNNIFIPRSASVRYLIYTSEEPYQVNHYCSFIGDKPLSCASEYFSNCKGNYLAIPNPNYINLREYIREYKHLLGCEYCGAWFDNANDAVFWTFTEDKLVDFDIKYKPLRLITEDDDLVSYKEYMELYYPEYRDVWEKQL